jgi:hypothetical protein
MAARFAWVLNLDADIELAHSSPGPYEPTKIVKAAMKPHVATLAASLLGPGDVLVDEDAAAGSARGLVGRAFCPTPRALGILVRAGAEPEPHPRVEVLRRVNSRAFAASLGDARDTRDALAGAAFVVDLARARSMLAERPPVGDAWRVKYAFGMAGRNQRVMRAVPPDDADFAFVRSGVERGGVQVEPNVVLEEEYGIHGFVNREKETRLGSVVKQRCDARGAWVATERLEAGMAVVAGVEERMAEEGRRVGDALREAGYWGPFGVDGFAYRGERGEIRLRARSEINARYSMGFGVGGVAGVGMRSGEHP